MIKGMEILSKTEIMESKLTGAGAIYACMFFGLFFIAVIAAIIVAIKNYNATTAFVALFCVAFVCAVFGFVAIGANTEEAPTGRYEYVALLDDSVSIKEIYENYEVVDVRENTCILRDREPVDSAE